MSAEEIRAIAFHLPQFHPIPENDAWWGKGFTEWTNVAKARPLFPGHYQPHLPADLGYYDLRLAEARQAQADLAREYGIHGFCYYHYWFSGRRLLGRPVDDILASGKPDFPFCLCWANESWTRRWDGQEKEILVAQRYSPEDDLNHIRWLATVFRDPRYIRMDGRPVFLVYRLSRLPDPAQTVETWRQEFRRLTGEELYLCNAESFGTEHGLAPRYHLDAAVEFAPDHKALPKPQTANSLTYRLRGHERWQRWAARAGWTQPWLLDNGVLSYSELAKNMMAKPDAAYLRFPCVVPAWDNTARRPTGATLMEGSTPELYQKWLTSAVERVKALEVDQPFVFINAWNEWAEGNHLEPCQKWGHAYLEATRQALSGASVPASEVRTAPAKSTARPGHRETAPAILVPSSDAESPFWSVMIPAYNPRADFLEETLRCVLAQDPGPQQMQIAVVDDCSPSGEVEEIVRSVAGDRVEVWRTPQNLGLAGCWNTCIRQARGQWIHILHQDDLVYPGFYQALRKGVEIYPEAGAAYCRHAFCDENGNWHRMSTLEMASPGLLKNFVELLITDERIQCASIVVKKSTYERLGFFNEELKHALDWEMWIRIANQYPIFYEPKILACWRNHSAATTSRQIRSGENIRDIAKAISIWKAYLPAAEGERLARLASNHIAHAGFGMAQRLFRQNDYEASLNQAKAALLCKSTFRLRLSAAKLQLKAFMKTGTLAFKTK